jgi:uncharacterized protein YacL
MSTDFIFRIVGMIVFAALGGVLGQQIGQAAALNPSPGALTAEQYTFTMALVGALFGLIFTPYFTIRPARWLLTKFKRLSAQSLFSGLIGAVSGLILAALLAYPLSLLPDPVGNYLPFFMVLVLGYAGVSLFVTRQDDFLSLLTSFRGAAPSGKEPSQSALTERTILLDTSVIIDGRIADISRTGFLPGSLLIPRFVLNELQYIADSSDALRRQRGRRGMEVLASLQKEPLIPVRISDIDVEGVREVDDKLVVLARQLKCPILTNDYNLNRVAELQGVVVLNVNELANAVKSVLLPGEVMSVHVIQEGRESGQGVGYMDDGTMVVVENGRDYMDREIPVTVTKVLQTAAGRMIFARPEETIWNER